MGCCLFASVLAGAPRLGFILLWLARPVQVQTAFNDSFFIALLGLILAPWTALTYAFVYPGGVTWFDWVFLAFAVMLDIGTYTGGGVANKRRYE